MKTYQLLFVLAFFSITQLGLAASTDPHELDQFNEPAQGTEVRAQEEAPAVSDGLPVQVPSDITTLERLRKWLKRFPEKDIAIKIGAVWCGPCQALAPKVEEIAKKKQGQLKVVTLDFDQMSPELKQDLYVKAGVPAASIQRVGVPVIISLDGQDESKPLKLYSGKYTENWLKEQN